MARAKDTFDRPQAVALTIAGSDPSGGAGIQADLKTFHQFGVYGMSALTLLTVQNTQRVSRVELLPADLVLQQLDAVLEDIPPAAAKTGALGSGELIQAVAERARHFQFPLVVDPVMISKHGAPLLADDAREALLSQLLPHALLVTPNWHEALSLAGLEEDSPGDPEILGQRAAEVMLGAGAGAVLIKGGHRPALNPLGPPPEANDVLYYDGDVYLYAAPRLDTRHTHGTGCTYSAAITALLARGTELVEAVGIAKQYIHRAIAGNPGLGKGMGPVNHFSRTSKE
jgi:hydroxymethylpyrimidine/phosphomethylpyrimidine kinase